MSCLCYEDLSVQQEACLLSFLSASSPFLIPVYNKYTSQDYAVPNSLQVRNASGILGEVAHIVSMETRRKAAGTGKDCPDVLTFHLHLDT